MRWIGARFEMGDSRRKGDIGVIHAIIAIQQVSLNTRARLGVAKELWMAQYMLNKSRSGTFDIVRRYAPLSCVRDCAVRAGTPVTTSRPAEMAEDMVNGRKRQQGVRAKERTPNTIKQGPKLLKPCLPC